MEDSTPAVAAEFDDPASLVSYESLKCDYPHCSKHSNPESGCGVSKRCGRCRCVYYCSTACMRRHWNESHKDECVDFRELAVEKAKQDSDSLNIRPPLLTDDDDILQCGLCMEKGEDVQLPVVFPDCGDCFCLWCLKRAKHIIEQRQEAEKINTGCHCLRCKEPNTTGSEKNAEDILLDRYDRLVDEAMSESTTDEQKQKLIHSATAEIEKVVLAYKPQHNDSDDDPAKLALLVPRKTHRQAQIRLVELFILLGESSRADRALEGLIRDETAFQLRRLQDIISEMDDTDDSTEKKPFIDLYNSVKTHGLSFDAFLKTKDVVGLLAMFDISLAKAKVYEARQDWKAAGSEYQLLEKFFRSTPPKQGNITVERESALLARLATSEAKDVDTRSVYAWAAWDNPITRKFPGTHGTLASILKDQGINERAREVMSESLAYEAPWDEENMKKNADQYTNLSREIFEKEELRKKEEQFIKVWGEVLIAVDAALSKGGTVSWETIKEKTYDMFGGIDSDDEGVEDEVDEEMQEETARKLQSATAAALSNSADDSENQVNSSESEVGVDGSLVEEATDFSEHNGGDRSIRPSYDNIKLTRDALKDVEKLDPKYREFFVRRVEDLAVGRRSRIMQKRLVGCKRDIWETYLEQKSGYRILWTADKEELVIWYVVPHKKVSKMIEMIDKADGRSSRRLALTSASQLIEISTKIMQAAFDENSRAADRIYLDPLSDTPLKLHQVGKDDISKLTAVGEGWKPPLFLTRQEREIVEQTGTTLLLGRSGTGKTICICSRIHYDRHRAETGKSFKQLFVARSQRICNYVQDTVGTEVGEKDGNLRHIDYRRFKKFAEFCLDSLRGENGNSLSFEPSRRIDFNRFKRDFGWVADYELDPLIIWTQIRSFIKGSVEALVKANSDNLDLSEYLDMETFSAARCRLLAEQRKAAYIAFQRYEEEKNRKQLWDDCDLIAALHRAYDDARRSGTLPEELLYDRIYCDEIQDYTQSEIALFFKLCERGYLFLAGDPAQSVVEGVEFRFEEIRSVVYKLLPKDIQEDSVKRTRYIPKRPAKVTVNFRSHAGILNVAREVLDRLFAAFPKSAPDLGKDEGVFLGPRPGLFENVSEDRLLELVSKIDGVVVLAHNDADVERLTSKVGEGVVVLSIRDSKGLEFTDVILVDFFKELSEEHQKPWRELLREGSDVSFYQDKYPEIETQLKQLYTAITRCSMRFFVAETGPSIAGRSFMKFICKKDLASKQNVVEVEKMTKTHDQWISTGMDHAKTAEAMDDFKRGKFWLDKAKFCFDQAEDLELREKIRTHLTSLQIREELYFRVQGDDDDDGGEGDAMGNNNNDNEDEVSLEERAVDILERLAKEGLLAEAAKLCMAILPFLDEEYTRTNLEQRLVPKLPSIDD